MKKFKILLILVLTIIGYVPAQDTLKFNEPYLPSENKVLVFIPHNFAASPDSVKHSYPLMFLLHGYSGTYTDWSSNTDLQAYSNNYGFIIVCPDGYYNSWYLDSPILKNSQYMKFFWKNLAPTLLKTYGKIIKNKEIFITGLSMGGVGAMNIYISNESFFRSAGSMSGILDIREFPTQWEISRVLGKYEKKNYSNWNKYSVIENLNKLKLKNRSLIIDCGTEDFAYNVNVEFIKKAKDLGINVIFNRRKGSHNWIFWKEALVNHLEYFKSLCNN